MTTITSTDAQFAQSQIRKSSKGISESAANLASGLKKNANVADLSVGTVLRTRVSTLRTTVINAGQAKSLLNTAKGALETIGDLLQQQKSLSVKAADDSLTSNERGFLNQEFQAITKEINRIAENTNFNGKNLIDGSISGKAGLGSGTAEATELYSLSATSDFSLGGTVASGNLVSGSGALTVTAGNLAGASRTENLLTFTQGGTGGASTVILNDGTDLTVNYTAVAGDSTATATAFVTAAKAAQASNPTDGISDLIFVDNGNGTVSILAADKGDLYNSYTIDATGTNLTVALGDPGSGTTDVVAGAATALSSNAVTTGVDRSVTTNEDTFNTTLYGGISNIDVSVSFENDTYVAIFTAEVNGTVYQSDEVYLLQDATSGDSFIKAGQVITFSDPNGPKNSGGVLTDNTFNLVVGTSNVSVSDGGGTGSAADIAVVQNSLNTIATGFESQLSGAKIIQDRNPNLETVSTTDADIINAQGTFLDGLHGYLAGTTVPGGTQGDIIFRLDNFGSDGSIGDLGAFNFDRNTGVLTVELDGVSYSADLSSTTDTTTSTGQGFYSGGTAYNTSSGAFVTDGVIVLATSDTTDGNQIRIDLGTNVNGGSDITLSVTTEEAEVSFEDTFNQVFGVSKNESLSFQVGSASTDSIGISLNSAKASDLFKNDDGNRVTLDILTLSNAQTASEVLDNAINTNISLIAEVKASITSFDSAIENNSASIQNADAARSLLLDTDFSQESTSFAENTVRQDAGISVLAQINSRIQNLLQLLR